MSQFYVSLIFIGIILVGFSLILVLLDKKKAFSFVKSYEEKKQELIEIINDAEQMIEELNKFSDYVVTQMDFKNEELRINLKKANDEIKNLSFKAQNICIQANEAYNVIKTEVQTELKAGPKIELLPSIAVNGSYEVADNIVFENDLSEAYTVNKAQSSKNEKVIPINNKYTEALRLFRSGLNEVEIAKKLNMGKGEIQLILELNK